MKEEIETLKQLTNELDFFRQFLEEPKMTYENFEKKVEEIKKAEKSVDTIKALLDEIDLKSNTIAEAIRQLQHLKIDASSVTGKVGEELEKIIKEEHSKLINALNKNEKIIDLKITAYNTKIENLTKQIENSLEGLKIMERIDFFKRSWLITGFLSGFIFGAVVIGFAMVFLLKIHS